MIARAVWEKPLLFAVAVFTAAVVAAWIGGQQLHGCYREVFGGD